MLSKHLENVYKSDYISIFTVCISVVIFVNYFRRM